MNKNDLRAVMPDELPALDAHRIRHNDPDPIAPHRSHKGKTDALIAGGRLHDHRIGVQLALPLGFEDHIVSDPRLYRAADAQSFIFYKHSCRALRHHPPKLDDRGMPYGVQYVLINHILPRFRTPNGSDPPCQRP